MEDEGRDQGAKLFHHPDHQVIGLTRRAGAQICDPVQKGLLKVANDGSGTLLLANFRPIVGWGHRERRSGDGTEVGLFGMVKGAL